jgi:hypothetical protein
MRSAFVIVASLITVPALAQEPVGCDKFKWPIDRERALLADAKLVAIGADVADGAVKLRLSPVTEIKLPAEPSRNPKPNSYAGYRLETIAVCRRDHGQPCQRNRSCGDAGLIGCLEEKRSLVAWPP